METAISISIRLVFVCGKITGPVNHAVKAIEFGEIAEVAVRVFDGLQQL